jgi:hypothetical protein
MNVESLYDRKSADLRFKFRQKNLNLRKYERLSVEKEVVVQNL